MVGDYTTSLAADELLVEVRIPSSDARSGFAEVTRRGVGDFALAGAVCHGTAVVVFGAGERPQRLPVLSSRPCGPDGQLSSSSSSQLPRSLRRRTTGADGRRSGRPRRHRDAGGAMSEEC